MKEPIEFAKKPAIISTEFEFLNSDIKMQYIISNILAYNTIGSLIKECTGTFGTGYPFYAIKVGKNGEYEGTLPIIGEQLSYNDKLREAVENSKYAEWHCARCLEERRFTMPDLKRICNACPGMEAALKPRKLINRLPDLDMWMIHEQSDFEQIKESVERALAGSGFKTSDVDPVQTIYELESIVSDLKRGQKPLGKLPIDTHLIDRMTIYTLISQVPDYLEYSKRHEVSPYLPIHPFSLRKTWQQDDDAYNFIFDYLFSFTEFKLDDEIQDLLNETRHEIATKYNMQELLGFLMASSSETVKRRIRTSRGVDGEGSVLEGLYKERMESWRNIEKG